MLRNYLNAVVHSFITNKLFSFIDCSGLASAILISHYVANELSCVAKAANATGTTLRITETQC